jgi:hypothetical protein
MLYLLYRGATIKAERAERRTLSQVLWRLKMNLPKPVSPSEAQVVWAGIPNPSGRRVARALSQAGRAVHHSTVARWRADGWRTVASDGRSGRQL